MVVTEVPNLGLASLDWGSKNPNNAIDHDSTHHNNYNQAEAIVVADAYLLFTGDFRRSNADLVISKDDRHIVIDDYFKGEKRAALASREGAVLSGDLVQALSGEVQYAQAGQAATAAVVIGKVSKLAGVATVIRNGVSVQLNIGDEVHKGDVVQTAANSSLGLVFIDGTVFGLSANARMVLNEMVYDPAGSSNSSLLSLVQGTIVFVAGETAKRGDMRVETPTATMGIRGTAVLTEIDFVVPGSGAVPPVRVQVLEEPGGVSGALVLYSRSSPNTIIGQVNQLGQVTTVTGTGDVSTQATSPASRAVQQLIDQTMREYFPNYTPRSTSPNGSSSPPGGSGNGLSLDPINFELVLPPGPSFRADVIAPLRATDDFLPLVNSPPQVNVSNVVVALPATNSSTFNIADQVNIFDPDANTALHDVPIPFVTGTAQLVGVAGPAPPNGASLAGLINVDAQTGVVGYDPANFVFLAQGATVTYTIAFDSRSGPDTLHRTLTLTIVGVNEAPAITSASLTVAEGATVVLTAADIGISDPDGTNFTFTVLSVTHGQFEIFANGSWTVTTTFTSADIAAGLVRFTHDGGEIAPTFSIQANDGFDVSSVFTGTIHFSNVNDPSVALADTNWAQDDLHASVGGNVILGANHTPDGTEGNPPSGTFADVADTDVDSATLSVSTVNGSSSSVGAAIAGLYGTLTLNANGSYTYVVNGAAVQGLDSGESVTDQFTYTVTDGAATSNASTLRITVFGNNDAPVAVADTNWAQEDLHTAIDGNVILGANHAPDNTEGNPPSGTFADVADTDPDTEPLTVSAVNGYGSNVGAAICGSYGTLILNANGTYSYVVNNAAVQGLDSGETATDQFTYTVTDGTATSNTATLTITVFGNNDTPVAVADTNWAQEDLHTCIDGNVILGANHAPDNTEGNPPSGAFADVADTDPDNEPLTVSAVNGYGSNVGAAICGSYGTLTLYANGTYSYVVNSAAVQGLDSGETVIDQFTYTVTDGTATSNISTLTITVFGNNDAPVAIADTNWAQEDLHTAIDGNVILGANHAPDNTEGNPPSGAFADVADTDADAEPLTVNAVNGSTANVGVALCGSYGTLTLNANGSYTYVVNSAAVQGLDSGETATDQFTYTVTDGTATSNTATLTIRVFGNNDAPVAVADTNWAQEDLHTSVDGNVILGANHAPDNVEGNPPSGTFADVADADADTEPLTVNAVNSLAGNVGGAVAGTYGTLTLNANGSYTYVVNNSAVQGLDSGETVTDQFTYTVTDGTATSNTATLAIRVFGNNDAPVAVADRNWAQEDLHTSVDGNVILGANHAPDNTEGDPPVGTFADVADTDADIETLTVSTVNGYGANVGVGLYGSYGTLTLNANGSYTYVVNGGAVQGLDSGETATDQFTYTVTDGTATSNTATLTITVFGNNDAPVAVADRNWVQEDLHTSVDGNLILGANHAPDNTEGYPPSGLFADVADTDADVEPLAVNAVNGSAANVGAELHGSYGTLTLNANGSYTYVVNNAAVQGLDTGETRTDQFTYTVTDGTATSNTATLTITVFGNNDAPSVVNTQNWLSSDPDQQRAGDPRYADGYPLLVGLPTDVDGENVIVTATGSIPHGVFYFNGSCYVELTAGTLLYDPSTSLNLLDDLVYRPTSSISDAVNTTLSLDVYDGTAHVTETVGIHEVVQNHIPVGSFGTSVGGSDPLTSGNSQSATQVISQAQADAINSTADTLTVVVSTDFQKTPIGTPVPLSEQGIGTAAGEARETEVSVFLNITQGSTTTRFVIVADDPDGCPVQTWFFNPATGLMQATVDASQIFVANAAGDPTSTSLETWLGTHPIHAGDTWNTVFVDDTAGNYQARSYSVQIDPNDQPDHGIVVNGDNLLADQIYGTSGNDTLAGNGGNDIIDGRGGNDLIFGGAGADNFKFAACSGHTVIGDFAIGQDHIDLSSIVTTNDVNDWIATHVTASGQDTLISMDDGLTITLQNVRPATLSSTDFIVNPNGSN